jgi:hypothetical protein
VTREHAFSAIRPNELDAVQPDRATLAAYVGSYLAAGGAPAGPVVQLRLDGDVLRADVPRLRWEGRTLRTTSDGTFFFVENRGTLSFQRDAAGVVVGAVLSGFGEPLRLVRQ